MAIPGDFGASSWTSWAHTAHQDLLTVTPAYISGYLSAGDVHGKAASVSASSAEATCRPHAPTRISNFPPEEARLCVWAGAFLKVPSAAWLLAEGFIFGADP